jgi:hypothetical protein
LKSTLNRLNNRINELKKDLEVSRKREDIIWDMYLYATTSDDVSDAEIMTAVVKYVRDILGQDPESRSFDYLVKERFDGIKKARKAASNGIK